MRIRDMKAQKWNFKAEKVYDYDLPEGACLYSLDTDKVIACAQCGRKITFGNSYTSREIYTEDGLGYAVCEQCHEKEWQEERRK